MSIFDANIQDEWSKDYLISKIKKAQEKYHKESPCVHCGPGNGCDDCRGCEDAKKNYELEKELHNALDEYKKKFGISYQAEEAIKQANKAEEKWLDIRKKCQVCGKSLVSGCLKCDIYPSLTNALSEFKYCKEDLKRIYDIDYDIYEINKNNKAMITTEQEKRDMIIDPGVTIKQWIDHNIYKHGAQNFFNIISNAWDDKMIESIKKSLLDEVKTHIKPKDINTIEDLAKLLDGNEYGDETRNEYNINVEELCKKNNWVVVFGYSDDNMELRGAVDDEIGSWDGVIVKFVKKDDFYIEDPDEETYKKAKENIFVPIENNELEKLKKDNYKDTCVIEALWCPNDSEVSWQFNCKGAPSVRFNIMEDEKLEAECLVIDLNGLLKHEN